MEIQYHVTQSRGVYIVMPVFSADTTNPLPEKRIRAINDFYASMENTVCTYAKALHCTFPHGRYVCLGEALSDDTGCTTVTFQLFHRVPGKSNRSRIIVHIWKDGLLHKQILHK